MEKLYRAYRYQINMDANEIRVNVQKFFQDLEKGEFIDFTFDQSKFVHTSDRVNVQNLAHQASVKIHKLCESMSDKPFLSDHELRALEVSLAISKIYMNVEYYKIILRTIVNNNKIKSVTMFGVYLKSICNKLHYGKEEHKRMRDTLLLDVRNMLSHHDYGIKLNSLECVFPDNLEKHNDRELKELIDHSDMVINEFTEQLRRYL